MPEPMIFRFGKYNGKGIEQVAMTDYQYYDWLKRLYNSGEMKVDLSVNFLDRLKEVGYKLDHFKPVVKCEQCKETAVYLSIVERFGSDMNGYFVTGDYFYCKKRECWPRNDSQISSYNLIPLKYSSITNFKWSKASTKIFIKQLHETFARAAGWPNGQKFTEKACREFIAGLPGEHELYEQKDLF